MMARRGAPLWLASPTRYADLSRVQARMAFALFVLMLIASLIAVGSPAPRADAGPEAAPFGQGRLLVDQSVVQGVRSGVPYYVAAAEAQRIAKLPLRPFVTVRLPTLAVVQASLPPLLVTLALLLLCIATIIAWTVRLRPALTGLAPIALVGMLVLIGLYMNFEPGLIVIHEIWAGPLIALSLALRRPGHWLTAVALGLSAMLLRETALLYVAIMALFAWAEGQRRETLGWLGAILVFAAVLAAHAHAVALVTGPLDRASQDWDGVQNLGFYVKLVMTSSGLDLVPGWAGSVALAAAVFGWLAWRDALATRARATLAGYALLIALLAPEEAQHAVFIAMPVLLVGIVFAADGLRDLITATRDTHRITVTRIIR